MAAVKLIPGCSAVEDGTLGAAMLGLGVAGYHMLAMAVVVAVLRRALSSGGRRISSRVNRVERKGRALRLMGLVMLVLGMAPMHTLIARTTVFNVGVVAGVSIKTVVATDMVDPTALVGDLPLSGVRTLSTRR